MGHLRAVDCTRRKRFHQPLSLPGAVMLDRRSRRATWPEANELMTERRFPPPCLSIIRPRTR
jgi:hypothetical protein